MLISPESEVDLHASNRVGTGKPVIKSLDFDALLRSIERVLEWRALRVGERALSLVPESDGDGLPGLVGTSPPMRQIYRVARKVARSRATVLITGESGTGKGELARAIHALSPRARAPFTPVPCASLPEKLLESELFGHEKGSFTGADRRRLGRFEQADRGTVFLDEIGEVPMPMQVKLRNVLQERSFERVGGNESISVDVRLIAATHRNLLDDVARGRFREDLYYRLNVVQIDMRPLRHRGGDILVLAHHFLRRFAEENQKSFEGSTEAARRKLLGHDWPGNVRALENSIERAVVLSESTILDEDDLALDPEPGGLGSLRIPGASLEEIERYAILKTLAAVGGSSFQVAEILKVSVRTIRYRMREWGISQVAGAQPKLFAVPDGVTEGQDGRGSCGPARGQEARGKGLRRPPG